MIIALFDAKIINMECIVLMHNGCKGKLKDRQKKPLHNGQSPSDNEERSYLSEEKKERGVGRVNGKEYGHKNMATRMRRQ